MLWDVDSVMLSHLGSQRRIYIERAAKKSSNKYLYRKRNRFRVKKQGHDESKTKKRKQKNPESRISSIPGNLQKKRERKRKEKEE